MNYRAAVKAFFDGGGQLQLGVGASLAVGPLGRAADVSASASNTSHIAATYAYSSSKGLYIGYSFEGSKISERVNTNAAYYGRPISARDILTGVVPPSQDAARLYDLLNSMGAGPRPGLPFASQRDKKAQSLHSPTAHSTPPPINYANRPPTTSDGFEEPPPPYQPNDGPSQPKHQQQQSSSFNQTYMNQPNTTDTKPPIVPTETASTSSFHRPDMQPSAAPAAGQAASYYSTPFDASDNKGKQPSSSRDMQLSHTSPESSAPPAVVSHNDTKHPLPTQNDIMTVVVAKYDYHSDSPSDLNFSAGDHIIVTKRLDDRQSWWEGEIGEKRGFFPANYTEELT